MVAIAFASSQNQVLIKLRPPCRRLVQTAHPCAWCVWGKGELERGATCYLLQGDLYAMREGKNVLERRQTSPLNIQQPTGRRQAGAPLRKSCRRSVHTQATCVKGTAFLSEHRASLENNIPPRSHPQACSSLHKVVRAEGASGSLAPTPHPRQRESETEEERMKPILRIPNKTPLRIIFKA